MTLEPADSNHASLTSAFAEIRSFLQASLNSSNGVVPSGNVIATEPLPAVGIPGVLEAIQRLFGLSDFERRIMALCAGAELDNEIGRLCGQCLRTETQATATFGLALAVLPDPHWSAVTASGPLRKWMLVTSAPTPSLVSGALRIDERILNALLGLPAADERLQGLLHAVHVPTMLAASHETTAERAATLIAPSPSTGEGMVIQLCGPDPVENAAIASSAASRNGLALTELDVSGESRLATDFSLIRLVEREMLLTNSALLIDASEGASTEGAGATAELVASRMRIPVFLSTSQRRRMRRKQTIALDVERPPAGERRRLWESALGAEVAHFDTILDLLSDQFDLGAGAIASVSAETTAGPRTDASNDSDALWNACRRAARPRLDEMAQRIEADSGWGDLILPDAQINVLHTIAAHVRGRRVVYEQWGFSAKGSRGLGIAALFAGASGTGKTLAAEVLAKELKLDLYRIDLSSVMSKYIGETEKNLRRVFDAAEQGGSILLFDEADALFGKRSEVKDSHDRFANIEVSYLLQRMECYRGLAILTTNLKNALDTAFLRRIRFIVQFPFPDTEQRERIWKRAYPEKTPIDGLDYRRLAQMNLTGGHIRNIALNSAFIAAEAGRPVSMVHVAHAAEAEYGKLEKPLTDTERSGWADQAH